LRTLLCIKHSECCRSGSSKKEVGGQKQAIDSVRIKACEKGYADKSLENGSSQRT
jgi:hypothetical protein